jgi:hypothetical protein
MFKERLIIIAVYTCSWRGQHQIDWTELNWTEAVQVTKTNDRPDLSSEGAPDIHKTVNVNQ